MPLLATPGTGRKNGVQTPITSQNLDTYSRDNLAGITPFHIFMPIQAFCESRWEFGRVALPDRCCDKASPKFGRPAENLQLRNKSWHRLLSSPGPRKAAEW